MTPTMAISALERYIRQRNDPAVDSTVKQGNRVEALRAMEIVAREISDDWKKQWSVEAIMAHMHSKPCKWPPGTWASDRTLPDNCPVCESTRGSRFSREFPGRYYCVDCGFEV